VRILYTDELDATRLTNQDKLFLYNGLDCLICREVFDTIYPLLDETTTLTYRFMQSLQAPVMEMQINGCLVDRAERNSKINLLMSQLRQVEAILNKFAEATWGAPLNARSPKQKSMYLYSFAKCTPVKKFDWKTGTSKLTTDRAALEKLSAKYLKVRPVISCILSIMDISKQLGTLRSGVDSDDYLRSSFNIAGTETGRFASRKNLFGTGTNFQNWAEGLRSIFTAPEGPIPQRDKYNIPEEFK